MAKQTINIGTADNDGTGDSIRHSFDISNQNFTELYNLINGGDGVHFLKLIDTPKALVATTLANPVVLIASDNASTVTQSALVAGYGIELLTENLGEANASITLSVSTATNLYDFTLISDLNPTLGGDLLGNGFATSGFAEPFAPDSLATKQYVDDNIPTAISMAGTLHDIAITTPSVGTPEYKQGSSANVLNTFVARDDRGDIYVNDIHSLIAYVTGVRSAGDVIVTGGISSTNGISSGANISAVGSITSGAGITAGGSISVTGNVTASGDMTAVVFHGVATSARYADLAENYKADDTYAPGTVLVFGGAEEVTASTRMMDRRVAGVVSTNPAHLMNSMLEGGTPVALIGRVPCKVVGKILKGDTLVTSDLMGVAMSSENPTSGAVIGKSLENYDSSEVGVIEVVVGKA